MLIHTFHNLNQTQLTKQSAPCFEVVEEATITPTEEEDVDEVLSEVEEVDSTPTTEVEVEDHPTAITTTMAMAMVMTMAMAMEIP